jgi:imidazole glycerol-phosphate synthase subunit HisH
MKTVAIVDYGMGNLDSVARAVEECGGEPLLVRTASELGRGGSVILPGVGSFTQGMRNLRVSGMVDALQEYVVERGMPFLGLCLGMQLLATRGEEGGGEAGLGWINGEVARLRPQAEDERVPHVGWNEVVCTRESPLFAGLDGRRDFYFVHSYTLACEDEGDVLASTPYRGGFTSAVEREHVRGLQFHPEKSQRAGFQVLRNFIGL